MIDKANSPAPENRVPVTFDPQELAVLGSQMSAAGLNGAEVGAVVDMAQKLALKVALSMVPTLMELVIDTHKASAREVARRINAETSFFGVPLHVRCVEIARQVAASPPKHER